jgi:hypothetical protein
VAEYASEREEWFQTNRVDASDSTRNWVRARIIAFAKSRDVA